MVSTNWTFRQNRFSCAMLTLLMMTAESMLSKRPVLGYKAFFFFKKRLMHEQYRIIREFTTAGSKSHLSERQSIIEFSRLSGKGIGEGGSRFEADQIGQCRRRGDVSSELYCPGAKPRD